MRNNNPPGKLDLQLGYSRVRGCFQRLQVGCLHRIVFEWSGKKVLYEID